MFDLILNYWKVTSMIMMNPQMAPNGELVMLGPQEITYIQVFHIKS